MCEGALLCVIKASSVFVDEAGMDENDDDFDEEKIEDDDDEQVCVQEGALLCVIKACCV